MTERLYDDPSLCEWFATIVRSIPAAGGSDVVLDRSAFYPTGGGQPCDHGWIGEARVTDVREEGGEVVHRVEGPAPSGALACRIDGKRRWDHLQQHHGQHILSAAFRAIADLETVSFHLGSETCSIDLGAPDVPAETARRAEGMANEIVRSNRDVRIRAYTPEEAKKLHLHKAPPQTDRVRIVEIDGFDWTPCGGTHPARTGAVGSIVVLGREKVRGCTRVTFVCGGRAQRITDERIDLVDRLCAILKVPAAELPARVERLAADVARLEKDLQHRRGQEEDALAESLLETGECFPRGCVVRAALAGRDQKTLAHLAARLIARPHVVALLGGDAGGAALVFARSADLTDLDLRDIHRDACDRVGGKGGGSPHLVQGAGTDASALKDALDLARARVAERLGGR